MQELTRNLRLLVDDMRIVSGLAVAYGDGHTAHKAAYGNAGEVRQEHGALVPDVRPLTPDAIFDLASVTKLFTCLAVMQLWEQGALKLETTVGALDKRFVHIAHVTVEDLLCFRPGLSTTERIDAQTNREQGEALLFTVRPGPLPAVRYYTDMTAMVLKYLVEAVTGMPLYGYLFEHILKPLGMDETFCKVPETLHPRVVDYNYERRIINDRYTIDRGCTPGTPHDHKARVLSKGGEDLCGHAGLFSTMDDMVRLAQGLIQDRVVSRKTLLEIGKNRTGYALPDGSYTQYLGYLCFAKHPQQTFSEVPACFGHRTIACNGFTGNHFSVDPEKNQFMIILANRIHNRVTFANSRPNPNDPTLSIRWEDGAWAPLSQNYTYLKDGYLKEPMARLLEG